nr:carbohydrate kinase [Rhizobium sp. Khangiran2]
MNAQPHRVAVIDIGKSNAKVALVDLERLEEIAVRKRPNLVLVATPYPHYDTDGLWSFILTSLAELQASHGVDAIVVTTHGAAAALLNADGDLAAPILDYEHYGPDRMASEYDAIRPSFTETGSPRLPMGLNLGAQLFWQFATFPDIRERTHAIVTYPQYWVARLTGAVANEVTSLGCHTDLWRPYENRFSSLVEQQGWLPLMAPIRRAKEKMGCIKPEIAAATGITADTVVYCGIHDSNASLYAHLVSRASPFAVVSTGTWVISMVIGGRTVPLDPHRDTLVNVNALGDPVATSRFMGGREFSSIMDGREARYQEDDVVSVITDGAMLAPSVERRSGPFPGRIHYWTVEEAKLSDGQRYVAVSFYLAMMTAIGLEIAGADGDILVEGPFSQNPLYLDMLASACRRPVFGVTGTGTSIGAALLAAKPDSRTSGHTGVPPAHTAQPLMEGYDARWRKRFETGDTAAGERDKA